MAVVNPRHTRQFAKGLGWLAKTDRLDALLPPWYGGRRFRVYTKLACFSPREASGATAQAATAGN